MKTIAILMILVASTAWAGEVDEQPYITFYSADYCEPYYKFEPKEDITAYELSQAMIFILPRLVGNRETIKKSDIDQYGPAKRHFTWHGCEKEK